MGRITEIKRHDIYRVASDSTNDLYAVTYGGDRNKPWYECNCTGYVTQRNRNGGAAFQGTCKHVISVINAYGLPRGGKPPPPRSAAKPQARTPLARPNSRPLVPKSNPTEDLKKAKASTVELMRELMGLDSEPKKPSVKTHPWTPSYCMTCDGPCKMSKPKQTPKIEIAEIDGEKDFDANEAVDELRKLLGG